MRRLLVIAIVATTMSFTLRAQPQTATAQPAARSDALVVGSGNFFSPIVGNLDRAIAFYRDGLGLDLQGQPASAENNEPLRHMFGVPEAQIRWQVGRPPAMRTGVEIVEISRIASRPAERRVQDAGAFTLVVLVRDVAAALGKLTQAGAPVLTRGGAAVDLGPGKGHAVLTRDPDGHYIELLQPEVVPDTAANTANVIGVRVRLTVDDVEKTLRLYRDTLGLQNATAGAFAKDKAMLDMLGLAKGEYRVATAQVPGSGLNVEFIDFKGIDRRAVTANIQDPGSTRMQLQVRDVDATIAALKAAGGTVQSTGGTSVALPAGRGGNTIKVAIVRDPNNLFLVLIETAPPRA